MLRDSTIKSRLAVNSFPGRAKLTARSEPEAKLSLVSAIARVSPYELLVIWHKIQSPRPASASTTVGRRFARDRSEKGKGTRTIVLAVGVTSPHPPRAGSSPQPVLVHLTVLFRAR